ncbi:MAG: RluA family pseudouridine synthase [Parachlamydiales bacterium]
MLKKEITEQISLLNALKLFYPDSSNKTLRDILNNKRVSVDNVVCYKANLLLNPGQIVSIGPIIKPLSFGLKILFEDKHIVIINKPLVLLSVPTDTNKEANILSILRKYFKTNEIFAVHRIDKETSGVMIFAKGEECQEKLDEMFKNHDFKRVYHAIVQGNVINDEGTWESRLVELGNFQVVSTKNEEEGKLAITHYKVLKRSKNYTYLELTLETGRKHQIRVHCKDFGHPIAGDKRYGTKGCDPISRICLHAYLLEFIHPFTNKKMAFVAQIPSRFEKVI